MRTFRGKLEVGGLGEISVKGKVSEAALRKALADMEREARRRKGGGLLDLGSVRL